MEKYNKRETYNLYVIAFLEMLKGAVTCANLETKISSNESSPEVVNFRVIKYQLESQKESISKIDKLIAELKDNKVALVNYTGDLKRLIKRLDNRSLLNLDFTNLEHFIEDLSNI